jgi:hypothetical protein
MRKLLLLGLLGLLTAGIVSISPICRRPDTFSAKRASISFRHHPEWSILPLTSAERQNLTQILSQPFHHLAGGSQSFAFESADGKYVIKFFRIKRLVPRPIHCFRPKKIANRQRNLHLLFNAYKLMYEKFRKESGLVYIHLNKSKDLNLTLHVQDRINQHHVVDLDQVPFIIQEKAELLMHRLVRLKAEKKDDELEAAVSAFLGLVKQRIEAGITDLDPGIDQNYGFIGDRPIQIDVGRVYVGEQAGEYERISKRLNLLLQKL